MPDFSLFVFLRSASSLVHSIPTNAGHETAAAAAAARCNVTSGSPRDVPTADGRVITGNDVVVPLRQRRQSASRGGGDVVGTSFDI